MAAGGVSTANKIPAAGPSRISLHRGSGLDDDLISTPSRTFGQPTPKTSWKSMKSMPPEISEYAIDPAIWRDTKEIPAVKEDDKVDVFQRTLTSLRSPMPQKVFGAQELKHLVKVSPDRTFIEVIPVLESELKRCTEAEFHTAAGSSMLPVFRAMVKSRNVGRLKQVIDFVKHNLIAYDDAELVAVWLECMEGIMDYMSPRDAASHVLPLIMDMADGKKAPLPKKAAIILARKLLQASSDPKVWQSLWELERSRARDADATVRAAAVSLAPDLAKKLETSQVGMLVTEVVRAAEETEVLVKAAVVDALGKMNSVKLDKNAAEMIVKLFKRLLHEAFSHKPQNLVLLVHCAKFIGIICETCAGLGALGEEDKVWFLDAVIELCRFDVVSKLGTAVQYEMPPGMITFRNKVGGSGPIPLLSSVAKARRSVGGKGNVAAKPVENNNPPAEFESWMVRAHCAANFYHFATFAKPLIDFKGGVYNILSDLFRDPHPNVRKNIAANLLPIMELAGDQGGLCKDEVVKALADDNVDVIEAVVPQLAGIMKVLVKTHVVSPDGNTAALPEIGGVLLFCEERLSQTRDWRVHSSLLLQLVVLPFCIPCDYIYHNFVPILLHRLLHLNQLPSRLGAAEALVSVLRHSRRAAQRDDIRKKIRGFAHSRKAQDRLLYLYMSNMIMDRFSRKYFKEHFFETTLGLTEDSVSNVRTKTVRMIPKMREKATDDLMTKRLEEVLEKVTRSETDKDAMEAIRAAVEELQKIGAQKPQRTRMDKEDEKKELEEQFVASLESKMTKPADQGKLSGVDAKHLANVKGPERHLYAPATKVTPGSGLEQSKGKGGEAAAATAEALKSSASGAVGFYGGPQDSKNIVPLAKGKSKMLALTPDDSSSRTTPQQQR